MLPVPLDILPETSPFQQSLELPTHPNEAFSQLQDSVYVSFRSSLAEEHWGGERKGSTAFKHYICNPVSMKPQHMLGPPLHHIISKNGQSPSNAGKTSPLYQTAFKTQLWASFLPRTMPFWCKKFCNPKINIIRGEHEGEMTTAHCLPWQWFHARLHVSPSDPGAEHANRNSWNKGFGLARSGSCKSHTMLASHG